MGAAERQRIADQVHGLYAAFASGDQKRYRDAFAPDHVWHVPGDNPVSGEYAGESYFTDMVQRMQPLDAWRFEVSAVMVNERARAAMVKVRVTGTRRGNSVDIPGCHMIRLDQDGRILEGWGFLEDQAALDRFFSA